MSRAAGVLFRVAGSAHIGYGHVVRALHLAKALGVEPRVSIRGTVAAAETARRLGARVETLTPAALGAAGLRLLVIDDPSAVAGRPWLRAARRAGLPVVSVHDRSMAPLPSDLAVDGSLGATTARAGPQLGRPGGARCLGPRFAVLAPEIARRLPLPMSARRSTLVVSTGGGRHAAVGLGIAAAFQSIGPTRARILLSLGLEPAASGRRRTVPPGVEVMPPERLRRELARASLAIVAGGTTLYEACALGTPAVAVAVVPGQRATVAAFARRGIAASPRAGAGAGPRVGSAGWSTAVAAAAWQVWRDRTARQRLAAQARQTIDGRGAARVARAIAALLARPTAVEKERRG